MVNNLLFPPNLENFTIILNMDNPESLIIDIISNPFNSNYYRKFAIYYQDLNMKNEYLAILDLTKIKYEQITDTNYNKEQRKDD